MSSLLILSGTALRVARVAAIVVLALLALDLGDAWCDPLVPTRESAVTTAPEGGADPCTEICVDDCFCCASSVAAVRPAPISEPAPTEMLAPPRSAPTSPGFALPPDHVPLATEPAA